ncbi:HAMP domain-containing sensor histidine kinase [Sulfitobacter sp. F26204]|uniref:HAMP domain-containing sensor histidine kinase n=1 Tax=Sulfitobacter sp. F26204 TaxID=2996014 RepID=UPI00225E095F|nr:HAMP domain-containing sensor histidine kinase [Sulfitobacter sp. F26204]MCX7558762.1 HAMP domain-containing sensor histidine kinase [Sulfitobacter sp. F26204]
MTGRLRQIWRSMPLRLAILLVALFATVSLLSLAASYAVTQSSFEQTIRADLRQDLAGFRAAPTARAVALLVEAESRAADPNRFILSYIAPDGRIYGNGAIARDDKGFHIFSLNPDRAEFDGEYLSLTEALYGGVITVARSRVEIVALRDVFVNILFISLLPTVVIALSGGLVLARRSKRHVEVVSTALDEMTSGDLAARVEIGPRWSDDLVRIGGKLNQMAAAQEGQIRALRGVTSDIAHDLKTPLQRVALYVQDLQDRVKDNAQAVELTARLEGEVGNMTRVFQALLQLAQVEAGSPKARFEEVDLAQVCRHVVEVFEESAEASGHSLALDLDVESAVLQGDRALLGQMVSNLIENALRHTPAGTAVTVRLGLHGQTAQLQVVDTGSGIPVAERQKVLQRLYRLDRSRKTPGHGLGLSLVEAVATLHGARLVLEDNNPGLRVIVTFVT